ncbi:MAG: SDR family NAD(P)-dependent oxidoreductase [Pseudomonadota bacterium]|nr:SDR family NAD(P)-dependent oxidoreductase [Pseudomonadota bacterium]HJO36908.1 SDR family NAD(P)-dependent oxidoreductase [Gammaproteobacteria bacterium]
MSDAPLALVTGANQGIGYEVVRQLAEQGLSVILSGRRQAAVEAATATLAAAGLAVRPAVLDVADSQSIEAFLGWLRQQALRPEVLVNNAGVHPDPGGYRGERRGASVFVADVDYVERAMQTHLYGPLRLVQALVPGMCERGYGRIVNVSSTLGQLAHMGGGWPGYRVSKAALNALTGVVAAELVDREAGDVLINSVCPGWTRTALGGERAPRAAAQAARAIVQLARLPAGGPSGRFFQDGAAIAW